MSILDDIRQQYPQYADVSDGKLAAAIRKKYYADMPPQDFYRKAGLAHLVGLDDTPANGLGSNAQNFAAGMGKSAVDLGRGAEQLSAGLGSLLPGSLGDYYSNAYQQLKQQQSEDNRIDAPLMGTKAGIAGNVGGQALEALAGGAALKGAGLVGSVAPSTYTVAALSGATQGALQPLSSDQSELSRLSNIGLGAAGGVAGQGIANGIGKAAGVIANPSGLLGRPSQQVADLAGTAINDYGIPLSATQVAPSRVGKLLDSVSQKVPFNGSQRFADAQQSAFNRAVANTIGENTDQITPAVYASAKKRIGQVYDDITSRNAIDLSQQVKDRLGGVLQDAQQTGSDDSVRAVQGILGRIDNQAVNSALPGDAYQSIQSQLGRITKAGGEKANYAGQVSGILRDALDNSISQTDKEAWQTANQQYANLKTIRDLVTKDQVNGNISPAALLGRVTANGAKKEAVASGRGGDLAELAAIGQQFLKDRVPNSGTAERMFGYGMLGGAGWAHLPATAATVGSSRLYQSLIQNPGLVQSIIANPSVSAATKSQLQQLLQSAGQIAPGAGGLIGQSASLGISQQPPLKR